MKNILIFILLALAIIFGYKLFLTKTGDIVESETGILEKTSPDSIGLKPEDLKTSNSVKQKVPVVLYSSDSCVFCIQAKAFLKKKGIEYQVRDINVGKNAQEMVDRTGMRGIPQIFINRQHIGGFGELQALDNSGDLDRLLQGL